RGMTAAFNRYLCYVAGRGGDDSGCTFQNLNDYYWSHGTVMLFFALERPLARAKICPIDGLDLFKEEQVIMRVETNPDQAKSGALVPASTPGSYIPGAYKCSDEPKPKPFSFF
ncbi:MAG: hypothetical protein ACXVBE_04165, partial [Bdellovibrionota bacterium]